MSVDASKCALCGEDNRCGAERGDATCWCYAMKIPASVLARIPEQARNLACVCERCVRDASESGDQLS